MPKVKAQMTNDGQVVMDKWQRATSDLRRVRDHGLWDNKQPATHNL